MGKFDGFLHWERVVPAKRAVAERLRDFRELVRDPDPAETKRQSGRCMDCGVPFCQQGCPLGNPIPDFNDLLWRDQWRAAYRQLATTNNFPEFTGRLCPAPCESACVLALDGAPVTIEQIEKEIIERAFAEGWVGQDSVGERPLRRSGRKVAVVGSGPAGLACAEQLHRGGHQVVIFEAAPRAGGLLRYGIPDFKLEKWVIDRRLELLRAQGIELRCGVEVGAAPRWDELMPEFDAVFVAIGARRARELEVPGRQLRGVLQAMDYLTEQNQVVGGELVGARHDVRGQRVIILGGGDTGSDCLGTALRQGAASVTQLELMPAPPEQRAADNPWPQWPQILRTSTSQEEGGERQFALRTTHLSARPDAPEQLAALHAVRLEGPEGRAAAHPGELRELPGGELVLPVDTLILAMGFTGPDTTAIGEQLGAARDGRGNLSVDARYATTVPGVFAGGDAKRGASLIVWAIAEGREAAREIDAYLRGGEPWLPTRGRDRPFGGR
jgi:glutamate synthase (NADPH) small chain